MSDTDSTLREFFNWIREDLRRLEAKLDDAMGCKHQTPCTKLQDLIEENRAMKKRIWSIIVALVTAGLIWGIPKLLALLNKV